MKKILTVCVYFWLLVFLVGCTSTANKKNDYDLFVGMVTDSGRIDDKSFNQGTWEGIKRANTEFGRIRSKYLMPRGTTEADKNKEITNLHDAGAHMIVTPGFKFENSIYVLQDKYPQTKFVLLDSVPRSSADFNNVKIADNTVAIVFAEHEAGFMAGVAAALQLRDGDAAFIGGMEIPNVQRYNWGYQQGVKYANEQFGTQLSVKPHNIVYQGTFTDVAAGQQIAAQMYTSGVKVVFTAAGSVGNGTINEAIARAKNGEQVWVIGCDVDQYAQGLYDRKANKSIMLTSAMKGIGEASFSMVRDLKQGKFKGGRVIVFNAQSDGVGLPRENPNIDANVQKQLELVYIKLKNGEIKVQDNGQGLIK